MVYPNINAAYVVMRNVFGLPEPPQSYVDFDVALLRLLGVPSLEAYLACRDGDVEVQEKNLNQIAGGDTNSSRPPNFRRLNRERRRQIKLSLGEDVDGEGVEQGNGGKGKGNGKAGGKGILPNANRAWTKGEGKGGKEDSKEGRTADTNPVTIQVANLGKKKEKEKKVSE
jgi:hypothetical protein